MTNSAFDDWFQYLLHVVFLFSEAVEVLLSFPKKGILIDPKIELQTKTVKQLKNMLVGVKRISHLKKDQLIDLVILESKTSTRPAIS